MVWAECLFADPVADIAVLGVPDEQYLSSEAAGDVPIAVELRRADVARNECYAALVTWATGLIVMRSW